jgi:hypothetical protein
MRLAWPIIVFFFSVLGLAVYAAFGRTQRERTEPGISFRKLNASVIHCVAGDGVGIITAMLFARAFNMTFWGEFWLEYATGFLVGWLIFQRISMKEMAPSSQALAMAFRAEFFSMLAVMGGMGAVMTFVTPSVVGAQPGPLTYAFWGFALAGLVAGYLLGLPMNWLLLKVGWKGDVRSPTREHKRPLVAMMGAFGALTLTLPEWLHEVREGKPVPTVAREPGARLDEPHGPGAAPYGILKEGLQESLRTAGAALASGQRSNATNALDAAQRAAAVGSKSTPTPAFQGALESIRQARRALQMADSKGAVQLVRASLDELEQSDATAAALNTDSPERYAGAPVVDARGVVIGELNGIRPDGRMELAIGGVRDAWGIFDFSAAATVAVQKSRLLFGPHHATAKSYVMFPVND